MSAAPGWEEPERIWWCRTCNGGVGCWGNAGSPPVPPPRCPECKTSNFCATMFIPAKKEAAK